MSLPVVLATACFLRDRGKTLLIDYTSGNHPIHAGKFAASGGKLEETDASPDGGVKREIREELNIIAHNVVYRGTVVFLNEKRTIKGKPMTKNWEVHFYDCYDFDASNARCSEGRLAWIDDDKVSSLPLHEGDRRVWEWMQKYQEFRGEIIHEGEILTSAKLTYKRDSSN